MTSMSVSDVMVKAPLAVHVETSLSRAERVLVLCQLNEVYVVGAAGELLGIVPDYEFLKARLLGEHACRTVGQAMLPVRLTVRPGDSIQQTAFLLRENIRQRIAVVENQILLGIITRQAVLRALMEGCFITDPPAKQSAPKFLEPVRQSVFQQRQILPEPVL